MVNGQAELVQSKYSHFINMLAHLAHLYHVLTSILESYSTGSHQFGRVIDRDTAPLEEPVEDQMAAGEPLFLCSCW